jgi:hypothetical protein
MRKKSAKPVPEYIGPIARTVAEIAAGPHCPKCGRLIRFSPHECKA